MDAILGGLGLVLIALLLAIPGSYLLVKLAHKLADWLPL